MTVRRWGLLLAALAAGAVIPVAPLTPAPSAYAAVTPPGQDPFYSYTGSTPLSQIKPGTVLKNRQITVALGTQSTPIPAQQLLYRTSGEQGDPTVTVTTVLVPSQAAAVPRIVDYLSFYDALGAQCDPSYTLQGGDPGADNQQQTEAEEGFILNYLANGYTVTVPDFEGETLDWTAGHESGYGALDAMRATESFLSLPATTQVAMTGYSGGSIAAEWGAELAPSYAPELNLVGVAAGGIPVFYAHNLNYINGSPGWSGIIPAALVGLTRAYNVDLSPYLSDYGVKLTNAVQNACIGSFNGAYPGLTIQKLLKPQYQDPYQIKAFVDIINNLIMGSVPGHPTVPMLLAVGNADGTGDGVMVAADVEALAHEYCTQGRPVDFEEYNGADHTQAGVQFVPAADAFLQQRFAGVPFSGNCASVGQGNSLQPLAQPSASPSPSPSAGGSGSSGGSTGGAGGSGSGGSGSVRGPAPVPAPGYARGTLAYTGMSSVVPAVGCAVILAALVALAVRRRRRA